MIWKTVILGDAQRGLLIINGRVTRWLEPGAHTVWWPNQYNRVDLVNTTEVATKLTKELDAVVPASDGKRLTVAANELAIISVDGVPSHTVAPGKWMLWQVRHEVTAVVYDVSDVHTKIPRAQWGIVPGTHLMQLLVHPYERIVLHEDGKLLAVLEDGMHGIHNVTRQLTATRLDLRETELQIAGQDVMTADKVSLRVNLIVRWKIVDAELVLTSVTNIRDALYGAAQMAARRLIAGTRLDALLEGRNDAALKMIDQVAAEAAGWGIEVTGLDLKDIVLPGEMKTILNQVIEAEKRAAANVITRREETAATRSLANTAKLLEANPTLLRLKELETMKELAGQVGDITLVATPSELMGRLQLS